jgi:hypothetical protein
MTNRLSGAKRLSACLVICAHLSACAASQSRPVVSEAQREHFGTVAIVEIARAPKSAVDVGPRGSTAGASHGAGQGALAGAEALFKGAGSCSGEMCGLVMIVLLPVFVIGGATIGGVSGAVQAVPEAKAKQIEARLALALAEVGTQEALRSAVAKAAARSEITIVREIPRSATTMVAGEIDYRGLSETGIDTVLEVGVVEVGLIGGGGKDPKLALIVRAAARLVDVKTNGELYRDYSLSHVSPQWRYNEWSADGASLLKHELSSAYGVLGTSIVEEVFLVIRTN